MSCNVFENCLDEYLEGALADNAYAAAAAHLQSCDDCRRALARVEALRAAVRNFTVPAPRPGFLEHALARAQAHDVSRRTRWTAYAAGAALAASLVLWIGFGWWPGQLHAPATKPIGVTIALHQTRTVQLAFNAEHELPQATLTITLPAGVELQGFPGQHRVSWQTNIARGANVLSLPLIAVGRSNGALLAHLEHGGRSTELRVPLHVSDPVRTSALPLTRVSSNQCELGRKEVANANV